jgi:hypothetical protein
MDTLLLVLGPALVVSFTIQQLIDLIEPLLDTFLKSKTEWILSLIALLVSLILTLLLDIRLLAPLGVEGKAFLDVLLTALFLTGGTKGINDLLKWTRYQRLVAARKFELDGANR